MCLPSTMVTRTRELMNASILDCRLTATILKDHVFTSLCALLDVLLMNTNETRIIKSNNALFFSLSLLMESNSFFQIETCFVKRFWYAHFDEQRERVSLSLSLSLDYSSSSIVPLFLVASSKKSSGSASRRVRVCAIALSLFSLFSLLL